MGILKSISKPLGDRTLNLKSLKRLRCNRVRRLFIEPLEERQLMAVIDLATLIAGQGTTISGADGSDASGHSVHSAGDVNGDGFDDVFIGAPHADASGNAKSYAGESYVIFGKADWSVTPMIDLSSLGSAGITIFGADAGDRSGFSLSGAGDVNGDGFDDMLIGAFAAYASNNLMQFAGESYLIFGKADWSASPTIDLFNLGSLGITIFGADVSDESGFSVSSAGDMNGDGFDDLAIGANRADASNNAKSYAGESYVVFGKADWTATPTINLANLGSAGITIFGAEANDKSGFPVSSAGDVNGDGFDDLLIGALEADAWENLKSFAGESYLIFGKADWSTTSTIDLANLGTAGITFFGADAGDISGASVSRAGDLNGDGFDDLLIGAPHAKASGNAKYAAGESYVFFGKADWSSTPTIDLFYLNFDYLGITIFGADAFDVSGISVSYAGDVNGDGFDDLLIGAKNAGALGNAKSDAGESYVIFGKADWSASRTIDLASLGSAGITIFGAEMNDQSGNSVRNAGDVNGDGFDDLIIGAYRAGASGNLKANAGDSYVIFGSNNFTNSIAPANLGTSAANVINGTAAANILNGADGNDTLVGAGGADVLLGGHGNDILAVSGVNFKRIVGGAGIDRLRLDGSGMTLDFTVVRNNRILDIEEIDVTGSGNNTLILNRLEVLNISGSTNTLVVRRNAGDIVNIGNGWSQEHNQVIGSNAFNVYKQGAATLLVQTTSVDTVPPTVTNIIAGGSAWSAAFIDTIDGSGAGAGNGLGYSLTTGLTLPNLGIDRIYLQYSEPVIGFNASTFKLLGVSVADYVGISTVSYDSANMRGVIQLSNSITNDKLRVGVSDVVSDPSMNALDGDSNASLGGILNFRFNILVGDTSNDGSVNGGDLPPFSTSFNKSAGNALYNPRADWNSDGSVNGGDIPLFSTTFNQSLPRAEPGTLIFPPLPAYPPSDLDSLYAPLIDEDEADHFFSHFTI